MTAIIGLAGSDDPDPQSLVRAALGRMAARGSEIPEVWSTNAATLGVVSDAWEVGAERPDNARLAVEEGVAVVADASLYYITELRDALHRKSGAEVASTSPAALILAAYRVWGEREFLHHIEGDFAFILWDSRTRRLIAARDHAGARPLFYAQRGAGLAVASRLDGLTRLPGVDTTLDMLSIADDALFMRVNNPQATAYSAIKRLPAGHRLDWQSDGGKAPTTQRWWEVPIFLRGDGPPFEEALEELRRLIVAAVAERAVHPGRSAIWLSGGYDSSALFAASHIAAKERRIEPLTPVSMSHPEGDAGREDELIEQSTGFWQVAPIWVNVDSVPPMANMVAAARARDEALYHTYEQSNRTLAAATRSAGFRVAVVGNGGDQFFSAGVSRLADHFKSGRFTTLAREWREAGGGNDWRLFFRTAVIPNLPSRALVVAKALRHGRPLQQSLARRFPSWSNVSFNQLSELKRLNAVGLERRRGEGHAALEQSYFLRHVTGERVNAAYTATGLLDGIEVRAPLFDSRVIRFASGRPLEESYSRRENKRLLRGAFRGFLPEAILGPRTARTGLPSGSLMRAAREHAAWAVAERGKGMILADLNVIDGNKFLERAAVWLNQGRGDVEEAAALVATTQVECWLLARLG
jgi:asparagine synthase (glutamine-hydrolysing)